MKVIGLTGGIGTGKTTVANMFKDLGAPVFIADVEAKRLMAESKPLKEKIKAVFGDAAYQDGELNRSYLADIVFNDKDKLDILNNLVHPAVKAYFKDWLEQQSSPYIIYEAAIIFELGRQDEFDKIILVTLDKDKRIERLLKRDNTTEKEIKARISNQWEDEKKIPLADYVINNISLEKTKNKVSRIHNSLCL